MQPAPDEWPDTGFGLIQMNYSQRPRDGKSPAERLLDRLDGVRDVGQRNWSARCPAHDDVTPSLSVSVGDDGRVLLHCHAGCDAKAIVEALGLTLPDLFPDPPKNRGGRNTPTWDTPDAAISAAERRNGRCVGRWSYLNVEGNEVFVVARFERKGRKTYRPLHFDGTGWRYGSPRGPWPLYRLREVAAAPTVYAVEGERCADLVYDLGVVGTTSAHGASSPHKTTWSPLAGKNVVVLPDHDEAGKRYADAVVRVLASCNPRPRSVKVVLLPDLPTGGDLVNFVAARKGNPLSAVREEIEALVATPDPINLDEVSHAVTNSPAARPYRETSDGLFWNKPTGNGAVPVQLTNFVARIVADVILDDGAEQQHSFEIEATVNDRTRRFTVAASRFAGMSWAVENMGASALIYPGFAVKDHGRAAIQLLSGDPPTRTVYTHTGWRSIDGQWLYLQGAGQLVHMGQ